LTEFLTENERRTGGLRAYSRTDGTRLWGCEQHQRTRGVRTDETRRATDLAVGGSSPSRRALTNGFSVRARQLGCSQARSNLGSYPRSYPRRGGLIREGRSTRQTHDPRGPGRTTRAERTADTAKRKRMSSSPRPPDRRRPVSLCKPSADGTPQLEDVVCSAHTAAGQQPRRAGLEVDPLDVTAFGR
jgi:hypothetical protein